VTDKVDEAAAAMMLIPAPVPEELFQLAYTLATGKNIDLAVYICVMDGTFVPEMGRKRHREWHEALAQMIRDAGKAGAGDGS